MAKAQNATQQKKGRYGSFTDVSGRDGYYRPKIEVGRWSLGMQIIRDNFLKLMGFNLFMLVFAAPIALLIIFRMGALSQQVANAPFAANIGLGFQPAPNMSGLSQSLEFAVTWSYFIFMPLAIMWLGLGLSGGMYVMRNLAWGERVRIYKVFLLGIKRNALTVVLASLIYGLIFSSSILSFYYFRYMIAKDGARWYFTLSQIIFVIVMIYSTLWYLMTVSMGVTYKASLWALMRNSLLVTTVLLPMNAFFAAFGSILFALLFLGSSFMLFAAMFILIFGISFFMLVWTVYSQWVFDKFINPNIKNKYKPTEEEEQAKKLRDKIQEEAVKNDGFVTVGTSVMSELGNIRPITEGEAKMAKFGSYYTRKDLDKASEAKAEIAAENDAPAADKQGKTQKVGK